MSRFLRLLPLAAVLAAIAVGAAGCGSEPVADAVAAPPEAPQTAYAASDGDAGWAAPVPGPGSHASALSEEFRSGAALQRWGYFEGDFGRNRMTVRDGRLVLTPAASTWADGARACFLYRGVRGDFDVRARLRVNGRSGDGRALAGLLVRGLPREDGTERWLALRSGVVDGRRVVQRQSTSRSRSTGAAARATAGWTDLRVVRRDARFTLFSRPAGGGAWQARGTYDRPDLPRTLEVGVDAFGGHGGAGADVRVQVDWVRFARS